MHSIKKIRFFVFFLIAMGLVGAPVFVYTQTGIGGNKEEIDTLNEQIAAKKDKVKQLEDSIAAYKRKIEQTQLQSTSLANQMSVLDNHIVQVELDIQATEQKLETLDPEIQALHLSIGDKELTIARQQRIITEFIRTLHEQRNRSMLEVLATYDNFSDFYNQIEYARTIEEDLGKNTRALRIAKEELQTKKTANEERKVAYDALKTELDNKKKDLEGQSFAKENLLAETQSSELKYKTLVTNLKSQYQSIESDITSIEQQVRSKLESQDKIDDTSSLLDGQLAWPSQSRYITAYFHDPSYPYRNVFEHNAIDIRASHGTAIHAAASGYIARARTCQTSSCYAYVMIVHSGGLSTVYGHLSKILVSADQFVTTGDLIGYSGGTPGTVGAGPFVTGPHLHFEVRKNGIPVNPLNYMVKDY